MRAAPPDARAIQRWDDEAPPGFSLIEMLLALGLTMVVTSAALMLVTPIGNVFEAQPEAMDMQQRLRAATDALSRDLTMAGAGVYMRADGGSLSGSFAPVIPRKIGLAGADPVTVARSDAVTITYVPQTFAQTTTSVPLPGPAGLVVNDVPNCAAGRILCGFQQGATGLVFDRTGQFDVFTISSIQAGSASVQFHDAALSYTYPAGARVSEVESRSYYFDGAAAQLRQSDGYQTDAPVIDNVVALAFEYFGDPNPPTAPRPPAGIENCLYDAAGEPKPMAVLPGPAGGLVPLPLSMLRDGPWCGSGGTQFDADLLRVRTVRVSLRVQASVAAFRAVGPAFLRGGASRESTRLVPDLAAVFTIAPRNLGLSR